MPFYSAFSYNPHVFENPPNRRTVFIRSCHQPTDRFVNTFYRNFQFYLYTIDPMTSDPARHIWLLFRTYDSRLSDNGFFAFQLRRENTARFHGSWSAYRLYLMHHGLPPMHKYPIYCWRCDCPIIVGIIHNGREKIRGDTIAWSSFNL
jgi:hypothetical protein